MLLLIIALPSPRFARAIYSFHISYRDKLKTTTAFVHEMSSPAIPLQSYEASEWLAIPTLSISSIRRIKVATHSQPFQ